MMNLRMLSLLVVMAIAGCTVGSGPTYQVRQLSSGKSLRVLGVVQMNFSDSGPALMLKYQTDVMFEDQAGLRKEADEIWADFKSDVEKSNLGSAVLSANAPPEGTIIQQSQGFNFVFMKQADGTWKCTTDK
jgi:hypothetical protein